LINAAAVTDHVVQTGQDAGVVATDTKKADQAVKVRITITDQAPP